MQIPVRLALVLRPTVAPGLLLAVGFGTVVFTTTPFLLPEIADHYDTTLGVASLISVFQLGGFVVATWGAGRWLQPGPRVFVAALGLSTVANLASAALPPFPLLVGLRLASGVSLGLAAWLAWLQAFGDERRMGDVAVIGPLVGLVAAPLIAVITDRGGPELLFLVVAGCSLVPLAFGAGSRWVSMPPRSARHQAVPAARILLVSLGLFTLGGSAVFQYSVVLGSGRPGLSTTAIAAGFSLNALAGIPAARWQGAPALPSPWMVSTAGCALVLSTSAWAPLFLFGLVFWGFAFWVSVPAVFKVLASRSRFPEERAGDAQAVMAAGRTVGPFLGGMLIDGPGTTVLGLVGSGVMLAAAGGVLAVRRLAPPTSPASTGSDRTHR